MAITAVVHVDDIFYVGQKERCDRLCVDLNRTIRVKNLGDLKWYGGCRYSRDRKRGTLTISQQSFAEELKKFRVTTVLRDLPICSPWTFRENHSPNIIYTVNRRNQPTAMDLYFLDWVRTRYKTEPETHTKSAHTVL